MGDRDTPDRPPIRIADLADHLDLADTLAEWHWAEWGHHDPAGSPAASAANLRRRAHRDRIPTTFVALAAGAPVGSVTILEHDMTTHPDLGPWLAAVYVAPAYRGQGVGRVLVQHAVRRAAALGAARVYLYTDAARGFYERLGWRALADEEYDGHHVTVMAIDADHQS